MTTATHQRQRPRQRQRQQPRQCLRRRNHVWFPNRCLRNKRPSDHTKLTALNPPLPQVQCWRMLKGGMRGCEINAHFARGAAEAYTVNIELGGAGGSLFHKSSFADGRLFRRHRNQVGVCFAAGIPPIEPGQPQALSTFIFILTSGLYVVHTSLLTYLQCHCEDKNTFLSVHPPTLLSARPRVWRSIVGRSTTGPTKGPTRTQLGPK